MSMIGGGPSVRRHSETTPLLGANRAEREAETAGCCAPVQAAATFVVTQLGVAAEMLGSCVRERCTQMAELLSSWTATPVSTPSVEMREFGATNVLNPIVSQSSTDRASSQITEGLTQVWDNVATNLATRGNTFGMDGCTLIVAGSTNATSDRDLTFVAKPTTTPLGMRDGATQMADTKDFWSKQWVAASQDKTPPSLAGEVGVDPGVRQTPLSDSERLNTMKALQQSGSNWFTAIEKYSKDPNDPTMLRNLRALEVEFTHSISTAIMANCTNVSEADFVKLVNKGSQEVFGKELGTMFDTNMYTAHSILKSGVTITNPEAKEQLMDANATKGLMKVAKNIIAMHHGKVAEGRAEFTSLMERSCEGLSEDKAVRVRSQFDRAFEGALVQADSITTKMAEIKTELQAQVVGLTTQLESASAADRPVLAAKIESFNQVLANDSELEMVAMNRLYESKLEGAQETFNTMGQIEASVQSAISSAGGDAALSKDLLAAFQKGDFTSIETLLRESGMDEGSAGLLMDTLTTSHLPYEKSVVASVAAQMEALVYANEPYYSQATVDGVVGGIQMDKVHEGMDDPTLLKGKLDKLSEKFPVLKEPETWGSCMQENFGDFAKDKHHYESKPGNFLFKGSKYLFRMAFSAQVALELKGVPDDSPLKKQVGVLRQVSSDLQVIRGNSDPGDKKVEDCRQRLLRSAADLGLEMNAETPIDKVAEGLYKLSEKVMVECSILLSK